MDSFTCPYCDKTMSLHRETYAEQNCSFHSATGVYGGKYEESTVRVIFMKCPSCKGYTIATIGIGEDVKEHSSRLMPASLARQFPDYIPDCIRTDYKEAYAISDLSPKASATLSRRCLQGMIRDFWGISKSRLIDEIDALHDKIPAAQWKVIDGVRRIGNIGAHMEKDINSIIDIEPDEAQKLLKLIEHLLEQWYINRHEQEKLYADIIGIDKEKQVERKKS